MCLAVPVRIKAMLDSDTALVDLNGLETMISTVLVDDLSAGDFVILHVGYALAKLNEKEALETLALIDQSGNEAS